MSATIEIEDDASDCAEFIKSELTQFVDLDEVVQAIQAFCGVEWEGAWKSKWEGLIMVLSKYQEQPTLLNPHLETLVSPLTGRLLELMTAFGVFEGSCTDDAYQTRQRDVRQFHALCKTLQLMCRVRGYKHVVKQFPHEVSHIEACMRMLRFQDSKDFGNWETRYVLMLWLCVLCIIPFDICSMDSSLLTHSTTAGTEVGTATAGDSSRPTLVQQIVAISLSFLSDAGPTRDAASACLSTLLTRPDMESSFLRVFIDSALSILNDWGSKSDDEVKDLTASSFQLVGILHCLSQIFKKGHRHNILPFASAILSPCLVISTQPNQTLTRKLLTKLFQRIGLTFLPPRVAAWRYQRGSRSLMENMQQSGMSVQASVVVETGPANDTDLATDDVPSEIEEVIDQLLCSLRDKDTVVRWSAAKGIGRLTMRLPEVFGDDVIAAALELFRDIDDDSAWHGGCLALAELSRRGLLLPDRLPAVFPIVSTAMHFDVLRGQHSVGAHVRDAACYVCWAFARAYSPLIIRPFVGALADAMIVVALFDREVNCRRAASAAFQENVGRQGVENFPLGIEVTAIADYFSLGVRTTAFVEIAPAVAKLSDAFARTIVDHLSAHKISHWDVEIRKLSARALGKIAFVCPDHVCAALMRALPDGPLSPSLSTRHGSVLFAAEVILSLSIQGPIAEDVAEEVSQVVINIEKARMFRGRGSEILREASCLLIENIARSQLPLVSKTQVALLDIVSENLKQPHENVQNAAARALRQLLHFYFAAPIGSPAFQKLQKMTVLKYVAGLRAAENVAWTRGYSLALGVLPFHITSEPPEVFDQVLDVLSIVIDPEHKIAGEPDADTRRNAVYAVSELGERLSLAIFKQGGLKSDEIDLPWLQRAEFCVKILLKACNDYSVDKRGDTGSWSRIGAMLGLERLVYAFMRASPTYPADKKVALFTYRCSTFCSGKNIEGPVKAVPVISIGTHVWTSFGHGIITELDESLGTARIHFPKQSLGHNEFISSEGICSMRIRKLEVIGLSENSGDLDNHDFLPTIEERSTILPVLKAVRTIEEMITSVSVEMFVCILLKQLGEKLDAVRGIAGGILARILASADPVVFCVRDRKILTTAIASRQTIQSPELNWKLSSVVFPFLGEVLKSETYFHWIISGFVISVGGLTEAIVKDSSKTLLTWCRDKRKDGDVRSISWLARSIHKLFEDYERNDRVILPLLKSLQLLLQNAIFDNVFPDSAFKDKLFAYLKNELNKCSDTRKIRSCIDIYMHLVNSPDPLRQNCIKTMLIMLGHQFPQVRKYVAEQLYLLFIGDPFVVGPRILPTLTDFPTADDNENSAVLDKTIPRRSGLVTSAELATKVMMYLADTVWDRQILVARDIRGLIAEAMGVSLNIKVRATDNGRLGGCKVVSDELDSYEALVRDAGY